MHTILKKHSWRFVTVLSILIGLGVYVSPAKVQAAACVVPSPNYGTVTNTVNIPTTTSYRIWSRIAVPDTTNNSFLLDIDGTSCYTVGGSSSIATSAGLTANPPSGTINWVWVDYQNGTTSSKITQTLTAGNHTFKSIGSKPNVAVDRVIVTSDLNCMPTGTGQNCANPPDTTLPTVSITAPANSSTVSGTVSVTATASDDSGTVSKVEFYIDNSSTPVATDTSAPYAYSWNTSALAAGSAHTITVKAYDPSNNIGTSTINVTIQSTAQTPGDSDGNTKVNILDLLAVINHWNLANQTRLNGELNGTTPVNILDLLEVLNNWKP